MICNNCNNQLAEKDLFCGNCGEKVVLVIENTIQNIPDNIVSQPIPLSINTPVNTQADTYINTPIVESINRPKNESIECSIKQINDESPKKNIFNRLNTISESEGIYDADKNGVSDLEERDYFISKKRENLNNQNNSDLGSNFFNSVKSGFKDIFK